MAASLSPTQRQEDFKEEFLACSICTEPYDNDQHQAKCLPCLHTYCKLCLGKHASKKPEFNCPNCRSLITLPGGIVDGLQNNFVIENLKDYHDIFNLAVTCGSCEDNANIADSFCHDCGCFLCHECVDAHKRLGPLRMHKLSTMAELQQQKCNPVSQRNYQCEKHPKQDLNLFCRESNCRIPVCASCGLVDHQNHDLVDIAVAIDEIVTDMQRSTDKINNKNQDIKTERAKAEAIQRMLIGNFNEREKEMLESKQKLINSIEMSYTNAHSHLKKLYQTEMHFMSSNIETLDSLAAQMTSACEFANKACDTSNPTQLLNSQNQIMERLSELESKELPKTRTLSEKTGLTLTDQHHNAMANIHKSLNCLFDNEWKIKPSSRSVTVASLIRQQEQADQDGSPLISFPEEGSKTLPATAMRSPGHTKKSSTTASGRQKKSKKSSESSSTLSSLFSSSSSSSSPSTSSLSSSAAEGATALSSISSEPQVDPNQCTIEFLYNPLLMSRVNAIIQTVDTNGQRMTAGGARVEAQKEKQEGTSGLLKVKDNSDGTYTFGYKKGLRSATHVRIHVTINSVPIKGSPFNPYGYK